METTLNQDLNGDSGVLALTFLIFVRFESQNNELYSNCNHYSNIARLAAFTQLISEYLFGINRHPQCLRVGGDGAFARPLQTVIISLCANQIMRISIVG